jgi:ADP-heptose:LPS heptosyltransferase
MAFLGAPPVGDQLEFPLGMKDHAELSTVLVAAQLGDAGYVCLHPGNRTPARRWPVERFAQVGNWLGELGLRIVITGGREETELTAELAARLDIPAIDLGGKTTLGALGALLKGSRLLIANDTGVAHLASALEVPSVVLFAASQVERWAPIDTTLHRVVAPVEHTLPQMVLHQAVRLLETTASSPVV